jgi:ribosomal protein S12 methylthiotransferase
VFTYCKEDGTAAAELGQDVPEEVKMERQRQLMELQAGISLEHNQAFIGETVSVMVDGVSDEHELLLSGRLETQAPDVDGQVLLTSAPKGVKAGDIIRCRVVQVAEHDLVAEYDPQPSAGMN